MSRLFRKRILALARTSRRFGTQTASPTHVCSRTMFEPCCTRATNNPIENDSVTRPSTLIQPKSCLSTQSLPSHPGQHFAVLAVCVVAEVRRGVKHIGRPASDYLFADEMEVEGRQHFLKEGPVLLILTEPSSSLARRFVLQLVEILIAFPPFHGRRKLPVMFHELLEAGTVDKNHAGDVDIFRFYLSQRVQSPILITLHIDVMVTRLPTALGGRDRLAHDLPGVQGACMILRIVRPATLSEKHAWSREH